MNAEQRDENPTFDMSTAERVANGAQIITRKSIQDDRWIVLCLRGTGVNVEFVTWRTDQDGNAFSGHYYHDILDAAKDFVNRPAIGLPPMTR
jgi:hypothetical protein